MQFKKLELKDDTSWFKRTFSSPHVRKTLISIGVGAIIGLVYFLLSEGKNMDNVTTDEIVKSMLFGAFLGFFISNSPCAKGRC